VRAIAQTVGQASPQAVPGALACALGQPSLRAADHELSEREVDPPASQLVERGSYTGRLRDGVARVSRRHRTSVSPGYDTGAWVLTFAPVLYLGLRGGGYDAVVRGEVGIAVWWLLAVGALAGLSVLAVGGARLGDRPPEGYRRGELRAVVGA